MRSMAQSEVAAWAASGAMALTGRPDGPPLAAPAGVAGSARAAAARVAAATAALGSRVELDGPALLGERAALTGMSRQGSVSVGSAARFERTADGWVVLNLPRPDDVAALPALLEHPVDRGAWTEVRGLLASRSAAQLVDRGRLLGLAVARPDEVAPAPTPARELSTGAARSRSARPLVVDLTSLWAGPLAGSILADAGARVIKVEGRHRPDGARLGPAAFFDLVNAGKETLAVDFGSRADVRLLRGLIASADLVIEASRPRAMDQIGIDPGLMATQAATSWLSITGHGRTTDPDRVGFGDDAAVAGGLWVDDGDGPVFVADAVADPLTGLTAAALGAELLVADRAAVVETPLSLVAAWAAGPAVEAVVKPASVDHEWEVATPDDRITVAAPHARASRGRAEPFDAHGSALRAEFSSETVPDVP